nr:Permease family [uncultured bacterium]
MEKFFHLKENGTTVSTEILAGLTTFFAMAYIIVVNPQILSQTGMPWGGVFLATIIAAIIGTLVMGLFANVPYAQAAGMGLNAFFTYTVCFGLGFSWQQTMCMVFLCGLINILITVTKIRKMIILAIPESLQHAIGGGIGLFVAYVGMLNVGLIKFTPGDPKAAAKGGAVAATPGLANFNDKVLWVFLIGLVLAIVFTVMKVKGGMLLAIAITTVIGIPFGVLGYEKSERSDNDDYRNGYKRKQVNSRYGSMAIEVPQDRKSTFEPQIVKKRQKDISDIDQKIISMYAKGMTTRQISETIEDIYGFETSESFISDVTDKILPQIEDWQNRPLDEVYPILYIDAIHYSVRDNGVIRKLAAYVILGINSEGRKEVLTITIGDNESAKYWLSVLNELKNRGVKDILIICADGLTGIKEAISAAFPKTEYQRCMVHQVRNTLKYVPDKDRKAFAADLKTIYQAADEQKALAALERVTEKWTPKYPNSMKRWKDNWDAISPIFKFSAAVRKVIYTTNAIESLNSTYRKLNRQRSVFPSDTALLKALYLATFEATKKWTTTIRDWAHVYGELSIMYEGRLPE